MDNKSDERIAEPQVPGCGVFTITVKTTEGFEGVFQFDMAQGFDSQDKLNTKGFAESGCMERAFEIALEYFKQGMIKFVSKK